MTRIETKTIVVLAVEKSGSGEGSIRMRRVKDV